MTENNNKSLLEQLKSIYESHKVESVIIVAFTFMMSVSGFGAIFVFFTMLIVLYFVSEPFAKKVIGLWKPCEGKCKSCSNRSDDDRIEK